MTSRKYKYKHFLLFEKSRTRAVREINDIHVLNALSTSALSEIEAQISSGERERLGFSVPTLGKGEKMAKRKREAVLEILNNAVDRKLYEQSMVHIVAIVEDYIATSARIILEWYPEKLKTGGKKVDVGTIIDAKDIGELISTIVDRKLIEMLYASPAEYFKHLEEILSFTIDDDSKLKYIELKAARDLLVHNAGIINDVYILKVGDQARGARGELVRINKTYFNSVTVIAKKLIESIFKQLYTKFGNSDMSDEKMMKLYASQNVPNKSLVRDAPR